MKNLTLIILLVSYLGAGAQNINPGEDEIYIQDEVAVVEITMNPDDKDFLMHIDNAWSNTYLAAKFRFRNSIMDTTLVEDIGIRLRGNTSRTQPKRSFKLKFKEFSGEKFYGYKKFNLKAENNDPSMVREMLAMQTFRNMGVAATRTHHVEFYLNGEYMGIYLNVEQLDDEFLDARFGNEDGNLYKCTWPATLEDDGQIYDDGYYELKTNEDLNDRSILAHFVDVLNNTSEEDFKVEIEKVFNVEQFIKYLAVEAIIGHWDGYSYNKNNFYLYENADNGLVEFMPYDTDNTFGINWLGDKNWATRDVLDWPKHGEGRPLVKKILDEPIYYWQYVHQLNNLLASYFSESVLFPQFDSYKNRLSEPISRDVYFPLTFNFTHQTFIDSYTKNDLSEDTGHLPYGLKPYVIERYRNAMESLTILGVDDFSRDVSVYPNPSDGNFINFTSKDDVGTKEVSLMSLQGSKIEFYSNKKGNAEYQLVFDKALPSGMYILMINDTPSKFFVN